jgi:hypothetical protein
LAASRTRRIEMRRTSRLIRPALAFAGVVAMTVSPYAATIAGPSKLATSNGCEPSAETAVPQPTQEELDAAGLGDIPLAPDEARRDLVAAPFTDPTSVTNPLFPIAELDSAILNGRVDGLPFYTETTLLPFTYLAEWTPGQCLRVLASQYMAFLDGRLTETAIDLYAQADDGSVWYLGEDVYDYDRQGRIVTTEGTWHAGVEGPAAMIMPSDPAIGDANRPENIPGNVFEEVVVTAVDVTVAGPSGPVPGAIVGSETHQDGSLSDKVFAPGYGEFLSTDGPDIEALALAAPTDALPGGVPVELAEMSQAATSIFEMRLSSQGAWASVERNVREIRRAWHASLETGDVPPRLVGPTRRTIDDLAAAVSARDASLVRLASIDVAYASVDLQLRYRPVTEVDSIRFELWVRRALVYSIVGSIGGLRSAHVTIE